MGLKWTPQYQYSRYHMLTYRVIHVIGRMEWSFFSHHMELLIYAFPFFYHFENSIQNQLRFYLYKISEKSEGVIKNSYDQLVASPNLWRPLWRHQTGWKSSVNEEKGTRTMTNMAKGAMCQKLLRWKCPICHIWRNNLVTLDNPIKVKIERINYLFGKTTVLTYTLLFSAS